MRCLPPQPMPLLLLLLLLLLRMRGSAGTRFNAGDVKRKKMMISHRQRSPRSRSSSHSWRFQPATVKPN